MFYRVSFYKNSNETFIIFAIEFKVISETQFMDTLDKRFTISFRLYSNITSPGKVIV